MSVSKLLTLFTSNMQLGLALDKIVFTESVACHSMTLLPYTRQDLALTSHVCWLKWGVDIAKRHFCLFLLTFFVCVCMFVDLMICNDTLHGVPLLLLANKQDLEVSYFALSLEHVWQVCSHHCFRLLWMIHTFEPQMEFQF